MKMATEPRKTRPRVGDTCWIVEWCYELGRDADGEVDPWEGKEHTRHVATKEEAEKVAREVYPEATNAYGVVEIYPAEFVPYDWDDATHYPHVGFWEETGDRTYYEGPDA